MSKILALILIMAFLSVFAALGNESEDKLKLIANENIGRESDIMALGVIRNGEFLPLENQTDLLGPIRLTSIRMMEARPPETGELRLTEYEGEVIMICGNGLGGGWIYSARVVERAGPILTHIVLKVFEREKLAIIQFSPSDNRSIKV
jgi:hypothetical protein